MFKVTQLVSGQVRYVLRFVWPHCLKILYDLLSRQLPQCSFHQAQPVRKGWPGAVAGCQRALRSEEENSLVRWPIGVIVLLWNFGLVLLSSSRWQAGIIQGLPPFLRKKRLLSWQNCRTQTHPFWAPSLGSCSWPFSATLMHKVRGEWAAFEWTFLVVKSALLF